MALTPFRVSCAAWTDDQYPGDALETLDLIIVRPLNEESSVLGTSSADFEGVIVVVAGALLVRCMVSCVGTTRSEAAVSGNKG